MGSKQKVTIHDTDLGKFSHGNFDFNYDPDDQLVTVVVRVKYEFGDNITHEQQERCKQNMKDAVDVYWNERAVLLPEDGTGPRIPIRIEIQENDKSYHKIIDVGEHITDRPYVAVDLNIEPFWIDGTQLDREQVLQTLAHEFGHILGNYDEYDSKARSQNIWEYIWGTIENFFWWHDNDHWNEANEALMGEGDRLKARYFDHFARQVSDIMGESYVPSIIGETTEIKLDMQEGGGEELLYSDHFALIQDIDTAGMVDWFLRSGLDLNADDFTSDGESPNEVSILSYTSRGELVDIDIGDVQLFENLVDDIVDFFQAAGVDVDMVTYLSDDDVGDTSMADMYSTVDLDISPDDFWTAMLMDDSLDFAEDLYDHHDHDHGLPF